MTLTRRQKVIIVCLLIYWPGIFVLAHIPIPLVVRRAEVLDKLIHFIAYLILFFLLWFVFNPEKKINWRKVGVWVILLIMVGYGVADEVLQKFVAGRSCDITDLSADLGGIGVGLILFSFLTFWPSFLVVTGISIFLLTNLAHRNPGELMPVTTAVFYPLAYTVFTILWIKNLSLFSWRQQVAKSTLLVMILALPIGFLLFVKIFSLVYGRSFGMKYVISAFIAIAATAGGYYLITLYRWRLGEKE